jgi:ribosomal protein S18 acetylase RimI-like enzyme
MNIQRADKNKAVEVSILVGELLTEIMQKINSQAFHFNFEATVQRLQDFIEYEKSFVFIAAEEKNIIGFITIYESFALYAEGAFGTIAEFYVKPSFRSKGIGKALIQKAK